MSPVRNDRQRQSAVGHLGELCDLKQHSFLKFAIANTLFTHKIVGKLCNNVK